MSTDRRSWRSRCTTRRGGLASTRRFGNRGAATGSRFDWLTVGSQGSPWSLIGSRRQSMTDYTDIDKLREDAYMAGSRALYGTDYMRGEKDRSYRLSRKIIDASGLLAELQGLRTEVDQLRGENERQNQFLLRVHRLSGEVLARPDRTMTVYELNRAING